MLYDKKWEKKTETQTEPWRDVLRGAAKYIEQFGWVQRSAGKHGEPRCVLGAIASATDEGVRCSEAGMAFTRFIRAPIAGWNDAPDRTKEQVVATLRAAAEARTY